jgi:hypothetical protein
MASFNLGTGMKKNIANRREAIAFFPFSVGSFGLLMHTTQ